MSLHGAVRQSPKLPILAPEPGSRFPARVFSAHRYRDPTRLPRIQSTAGGPAAEARSRHQLFEGRRNRGLTPAFRPSRAVAPLREENDGEPRSGPFAFLSLGDVLLVGPHGFPWTHRRGASNPLLQPTFRSRAPAAKTPSSETARRAPWENPPAFRFEILLERRVAAAISGRTPDHLAVIRPPTASCLTARRRLRVERLPLRRFRAGGGERSGIVYRFTPRRSNPLTPPVRLKRGTRERSRFPSVILLRRAARQCCPRSRDRGAFRRGSPYRTPSRAPEWSSAPAGRRALVLHVFIDVRKLRLDPSPRRSRGHFRAACASTTSADRCFNEHCSGPPEHPDQRNPWSGRLPVSIDRRLSIEATAEGTQGQGPRITAPRRSLPGLLPGEASPQPRSLQTPRVAGIVRRPVRS